ncbi:MAG: hypothetical protein ACR2QH_15110 [Geminicoccaceae bacterium]
MADLVFNISKGKVGELTQRVLDNDPAASEIVFALMTGAITDATLIDLDTFSAIFADAGAAEATFTNYARQIIDDASGDTLAVTADDTNDRLECNMDDRTFTNAGNGVNNSITRALIGYDPLGTGVDTNIVPLVALDFVKTTDGNTFIVEFAATGWFRAA